MRKGSVWRFYYAYCSHCSTFRMDKEVRRNASGAEVCVYCGKFVRKRARPSSVERARKVKEKKHIKLKEEQEERKARIKKLRDEMNA